MIGIYVHIPFCLHKCSYCDFHSIVADESLINNYLGALHNEISFYQERFPNEIFSTLYIGGGTPSCLNADQLKPLIIHLQDSFQFNAGFEFTIEVNPGTLTSEKISLMAALGVNRISLGAQAFQNSLLKKIGRIHTAADIFHGIELIRNAGIDNINLDLISGLPQQTLTDWKESLRAAIELNPQHLSCYSLMIEQGSEFYRRHLAGELELPSEEIELSMFELTQTYLPQYGYSHYEISNYAKLTAKAQHNLIYWHNQKYLGLGSGAHGYINGIRYANSLKLNYYIDRWQTREPALAYQEFVDNNREADETMMMGLRLLNGIKEDDFRLRFKCSYHELYGKQIKELIKRGLLVEVNGYLRLTKKGISLGNLVFSEFLR